MKIEKVNDLNVNDIIYNIDQIIIKDIKVLFFKYKGLKGQYAILEYDNDKQLLVNPLHRIEIVKNKPHIRFML